MPVLEDPVGHYLELGFTLGFEPCPSFDGAFLHSMYAASGFAGAPLVTWIGLNSFGPRVVRTEQDARLRAELLRDSPLFDPAYYARQLPPGMDPALHYAVIGESLGWRPSEGFDPGYYLERYPEIGIIGLSPLLHYEESGRREQRACRSATELVTTPTLEPDGRPTILIVAHDASRTGAPILGLQVARDLSSRYNIVSVLLNGGELVADFAASAKVVVGPLSLAEWNVADMRRIADRIAEAYRPLYAIANSVETQWLIPPLAKCGVPSVALVHEFASYTRPLSKLSNVFDWASDVVFPAEIVLASSYRFFPTLRERRGVHVFSQGRVDPPQGAAAAASLPWTADDRFTVLMIGTVQVRKGPDLFLSIAALVRRMAPDVAFHFVWIGDGYDPLGDTGYSAYLREQLERTRLEGVVEFIRPVGDLDPAYAASDVFLMCSRLDPQPNVGIDAVLRGLPVVCFEGACGTAEVLALHERTRELVAPHLDVHAAATIIVDLARDGARRAELGRLVAEVGRQYYDMAGYVDRIDGLGRAAAARLRPEDRSTLAEPGVLDGDLLLPGGVLQGPDGLVFAAMQQWAARGVRGQSWRPSAGFHPSAYAVAHRDACGGADGGGGDAHPLAEWVRRGRPAGPWCRPVFGPLQAPLASGARVLVHGHFFYPELAYDLFGRFGMNATVCDVVLTTDTDEKAAMLRRAGRFHAGAVQVIVTPNRGRNFGPLLEVLQHPEFGVDGGYELFGHVHGKRSTAVAGDLGERWREFLWDNLIGMVDAPMVDTVAQAFAARPGLGLVWAEEPHLVGWNENRAWAERLAPRLGIEGALPAYFDFPLGAMFWARPAALRPLVALGLGQDDWPEEPVPYDGTVLHALERLVPFIAEAAGMETAVVRVPGTSW